MYTCVYIIQKTTTVHLCNPHMCGLKAAYHFYLVLTRTCIRRDCLKKPSHHITKQLCNANSALHLQHIANHLLGDLLFHYCLSQACLSTG